MNIRKPKRALDHRQVKELSAADNFVSKRGKPLNTTVAIHPKMLASYPDDVASWVIALLNKIRIWCQRKKFGYFAIWSRENYVGYRREHLHMMIYIPERSRKDFDDILRLWLPGSEQVVKLGRRTLGRSRSGSRPVHTALMRRRSPLTRRRGRPISNLQESFLATSAPKAMQQLNNMPLSRVGCVVPRVPTQLIQVQVSGFSMGFSPTALAAHACAKSQDQEHRNRGDRWLREINGKPVETNAKRSQATSQFVYNIALLVRLHWRLASAPKSFSRVIGRFMTKEKNSGCNVVALGRGDFFAVDRVTWAKACEIGGMNAPLAYLVLARGAGGDNRTTSWSAEAINYRTNVNWRDAKEAIGALIKAGLVRRDKGGSRPRYYLMPFAPPAPVKPVRGMEKETAESGKPDWIWLPNALVDGAADETPPIEMVRESNRPAALRLLVELYGAQSLADHGGVHWRQIRQSFDRQQIAERGAYVIWGFSASTLQAWGHISFVKEHLTGKTKDGEDTGWPVFWDALKVLTETGLLEFVEHIIDSDTGEGAVLHPYASQAGEPGEREIGNAAHTAAESMLVEWRRELVETGRLAFDARLLPALKHLRDVQMVGLARLKYSARTAATAAWLSGSERWGKWAAKYDAMQSGDLTPKAVTRGRLLTSRIDQR